MGSTPVRFLGLDIETQRKGSDWGDFGFKNFFCGDMKFDDADEHYFSGFFPKPKAFIRWANMLRTPGIVVVAHNATYDMAGVSGELVRLGEAPLQDIRVCDTLHDGPGRGKMAYGTLAYMTKKYGVKQKGTMDAYDWDQAYAGSKEHRAQVEEYNKDDVECVLQLRRAMLATGHLIKPPSLFRAGSKQKTYAP